MLDRRRMLGSSLGVLVAAPAWQDRQAGGEDFVTKLSFPKTVFVLRHAEKAAEPKADPVLSEEGVARAERLAKLLAKSGVSHLYSSEFQRTQQTLAPLSLATGVKVSIGKAADRGALVSAVETLPRGSVIALAGHSNTVPQLVNALTGGQAEFALTQAEYDRLFVITPWGPGQQSNWIELPY